MAAHDALMCKVLLREPELQAALETIWKIQEANSGIALLVGPRNFSACLHCVTRARQLEGKLQRLVDIKFMANPHTDAALAQIQQLRLQLLLPAAQERHGNVNRLPMITETAVKNQVARRREGADGLFNRNRFFKTEECACCIDGVTLTRPAHDYKRRAHGEVGIVLEMA